MSQDLATPHIHFGYLDELIRVVKDFGTHVFFVLCLQFSLKSLDLLFDFLLFDRWTYFQIRVKIAG